MTTFILFIIDVVLALCGIAASLFGIIYFNDHLCIAGAWMYVLSIGTTLFSVAALFISNAINKEITNREADDGEFGFVSLILFITGAALVIAGTVCVLLVSRLFWIMSGIGGLIIAVGFILLYYDNLSAYISGIMVGLCACAAAMNFTYIIYDGVTNLNTNYYSSGFLYGIYNDKAPQDMEGKIVISGYNGRTTENIVVPSELDEKEVTGIKSLSFRNGSELRSVAIPASIKYMYSDAFIYCTKLNSVYCLGGIDDWCKISFENAQSNPLYYAKNLYVENERVINLVVPDGVTEIGAFTFYNCSSISTLSIPATVTEIGESAFNNCNYLTEIKYSGTKEQWNGISKSENWNFMTGSYSVVCTDGTLI